MTTLSTEPPDAATAGPADQEAALRARVGRMLAAAPSRPEKRRQERFAFPHMIYLTPVAEDGETPRGAPLLAAGKHLSEVGIGFYHSQPLSDRRAIVTLELPRGERLSFLLELRWCRFIRSGWYESGGRFLRPIATPDACRGKSPAG